MAMLKNSISSKTKLLLLPIDPWPDQLWTLRDQMSNPFSFHFNLKNIFSLNWFFELLSNEEINNLKLREQVVKCNRTVLLEHSNFQLGSYPLADELKFCWPLYKQIIPEDLDLLVGADMRKRFWDSNHRLQLILDLKLRVVNFLHNIWNFRIFSHRLSELLISFLPILFLVELFRSISG